MALVVKRAASATSAADGADKRRVKSKKKNKVLVTGADGFIGHALCVRLAADRVPVVGAVRALAPGGAAQGERVALGDFAAADWDEALRGVDVVVHLAGSVHARGADATNPTHFVVGNVHVTRRLLDAAARNGVRRVLLASTVKVYGEQTIPEQPFRAGAAAYPEDAYAHSKAEAEAVLWAACRAHGIEGIVLRLPLTYGAGVKGNFLRLLEAVAAERRLPLARIDNQRTLLYVGNAISAIEAALATDAVVGQTLPVADRESISTSDLVLRLARELKVSPRIFRLPQPFFHVGAALTGRRATVARLLNSLQVDSGRFNELACWAPPYTLDEGLAATAAWWRLMHTL